MISNNHEFSSLKVIPNHFDDQSASVYQANQCQKNSFLFLAECSYYQITKRRLKVVFSNDNSYYCVDFENEKISSDLICQLKNQMISYINSKNQIEYVSIQSNELIDYFNGRKMLDKISLIQSAADDEIECLRFLEYIDISCGAQYQTNLKKLGNFDLQIINENGFSLVFPKYLSDGSLDPLNLKEFANFQKYSDWIKTINCETIQHLNSQVSSTNFSETNRIDENQKEFEASEIEKILNIIIPNFPQKRIINVSGFSCSGKSTFSRELKSAIESKGFECLLLDMDCYFMNRADRPLDDNGNIDMESMRIVHTDLMADRICQLLNGHPIPERRYNYVSGIGGDIDSSSISLGKSGFLIVEGLHAINTEFVKKLDELKVLKVFVYPFIPLRIDNEHCFDQMDLLLLRRAIRDFNGRMYSPRRNIAWWPSVIAGKVKYISPYIETADVYCASQLLYELNAIAAIAVPLLQRSLEPIEQEKQVADEVTAEIKRLLFLMKLFIPLRPENLPDRIPIKEVYCTVMNKL